MMGYPDADSFYWDHDGWFYLYTWTPQAGWNRGFWCRGVDLCGFVSAAPSNAWHLILDDRRSPVVVDANGPMHNAACFHYAEFAPPGANVWT